MIKKWEKFNESSNESIKNEFKNIVFEKFKEFQSVFSDIEEVSDYGIDIIGTNSYNDLFCYNFKENRSYELDRWLEFSLPRLILNIKNHSDDVLLIKCGLSIPGYVNKKINSMGIMLNQNSIQALDDMISSYNRLKKLKFDNVLIDFFDSNNYDYKPVDIFALFKLPRYLVTEMWIKDDEDE